MELINNPSVPYDQLVNDLKISRRTVSRVFVSLVEKGYIERIGTNKKGYWKIIKWKINKEFNRLLGGKR